MTAARIIRMDSHGPDGSGLAILPPIDPSDLVSGTPVQRGHTYLDDKPSGLSIGVWDCTAFTAKPGPYSVNEFLVLLEGSVTIVDARGGETVITAGESFILPKGLVCQWKQTGYVRKFYVIFDDASGLKPKDSAALKVLKLDPAAKLPPAAPIDPALIVSGKPPSLHDLNVFTDMTGQLAAGVWDATPYDRKPIVFGRHELMHILEGAVTMTGADGRAQTFKAGDTALVAAGIEMGWTSTQYVRKVYCSFTPKPALA